MSWVFLIHILLAHLIVFPVFGFAPPKEYGYASNQSDSTWSCLTAFLCYSVFLIAYYVVFMLCSVLDEVGYIQ